MMRAQIRAIEGQLAATSADLDAYEAQRRNDEWTTTRLLAEALHRRYNGHNPAPDVAQTEAIAAIKEDAAEAINLVEPEPAFIEVVPEQEPIEVNLAPELVPFDIPF
jgi:2-polyprenyl-6-methoxyphenol hydroxylase-like FAD-dependent oxidoreductase